ncbi:MAG: PH domain-containing protein [Phycisphaerae bacterium]
MTAPPREHAPRAALAAPAKEVAPSLRADVIPEQLLSDGEVVLLAIKPSLWFVILVSGRFLAALALVWVATRLPLLSPVALPVLRLALGAVLLRLVVATLQWSARLYVLTDRRVLLIRGIFNVDIFECALARIQNTWLTFSLFERLLRLGSVHMATAAGPAGGVASWKIVAQPLAVHARLREAIARMQHRGSNGV